VYYVVDHLDSYVVVSDAGVSLARDNVLYRNTRVLPMTLVRLVPTRRAV